ncbi:DUF357 domain-containing protein [Candidatus Micrarchaeota archaeon]|nr:DUF357 domain-containing protein [Candidatus Micrarchaeota archaeon]
MESERARKSLEKLESRMEDARSLGFEGKYPQVFSLASQYAKDSRHYFSKQDYFTSFGCSDYAYGLLDALLIIEGKKEEFPE